jgi:hypothetical protein
MARSPRRSASKGRRGRFSTHGRDINGLTGLGAGDEVAFEQQRLASYSTEHMSWEGSWWEGKGSLPEGSLGWIQTAGIAVPLTTGRFRVWLIRRERSIVERYNACSARYLIDFTGELFCLSLHFLTLSIRRECLVSSSRWLPQGDARSQRHASIPAMIAPRHARRRVAPASAVGGIGGSSLRCDPQAYPPLSPDRRPPNYTALTGTPASPAAA